MTDTDPRLQSALSDRYTVDRELGRGGMAVVYLAQDQKLDRPVALKVLRPELAASLGADRFLREIQIASKLSHPNILGLFDCGEADGLLYYTMPYVEGETLRERMNREKQLPLEDALQITREVAGALGHAHEQGLVHRDVKPENILFQGGHAVVADFGIARALTEAGGANLTETGLAVGTPAYMSPEQAAGSSDVDGRADLYSLGCVLYEMLSGDAPYMASTPQAILAKKLTDPLPSITTVRQAVPAPVAAALAKSLARNAADRFKTTEQFAAALSVDTAEFERGRLVRRRVRWAAFAGAGAVLLLAFVLWPRSGPPAPTGPPPADRPGTVLARVEGNAEEDTKEAVEFFLRNGLDMAHVIQTVPGTDIERTLGLMDLDPTTPLDPGIARELATRLGVSTVVFSRLDRMGEAYTLALRVEEVVSGRSIAEAQGRTNDAGAILPVVDSAVVELRQELGEARAVLANSERLPEVYTPSLEALKKYQESLDFINRPAIDLLREAVREDTAFAEAWIRIANFYGNLGERDSARAAQARGMRFPDRLTEVRRQDREAGIMWRDDVGLWDESWRLYSRSIAQDPSYMMNFSLRVAAVGMLDSALAMNMTSTARRVDTRRRFDPSLPVSWCSWNELWLAPATGRVPEVLEFLDSLRVDVSPACALKYGLNEASAAGDWDRVDSLLENASLNFPGWSFLGGADYKAQVLEADAARGRITGTHQSLHQSPTGQEAYDGPPPSPLLLEVAYGVSPSDTTVELTGRGLEAVRVFTLNGVRAALVGDTLEGIRALARLEAMCDSATSGIFEQAFEPWFALMEVGPARRRGDWASVINRLEPLERRFREPGYGYDGGDTFLVWWVLADAYSQLGRLDSAIGQLESIVGPPHFRRWDWTYTGFIQPAAHHRLGQLYAQVGNSEKSTEHYQVFLNIFTDPDPEFEWMVEEARAELTRLGG